MVSRYSIDNRFDELVWLHPKQIDTIEKKVAFKQIIPDQYFSLNKIYGFHRVSG